MIIETTRIYRKEKQKLINSNSLLKESIKSTENLFKENYLNTKLQLKKIVCKKDKYRKSIRVLNTQYRILLSFYETHIIFKFIVNHDDYDRLNKNC